MKIKTNMYKQFKRNMQVCFLWYRLKKAWWTFSLVGSRVQPGWPVLWPHWDVSAQNFFPWFPETAHTVVQPFPAFPAQHTHTHTFISDSQPTKKQRSELFNRHTCLTLRLYSMARCLSVYASEGWSGDKAFLRMSSAFSYMSSDVSYSLLSVCSAARLLRDWAQSGWSGPRTRWRISRERVKNILAALETTKGEF